MIAHAAYPASDLMDMTADLMKMAKHKAALLDPPVGTIDFAVLSEATSEPMKDRRAHEYLIPIVRNCSPNGPSGPIPSAA
jgi:hypothetical protein